MKKIITNRNRAFTLIELLVAMGIIGVLSSIVFVNFNLARQAARDDIRKTDLKNLELAIKLYKAQNGKYPKACRDSSYWNGGVGGKYGCPSGQDYIIGLVPDYISKLPMDPNNKTANKGYLYHVDPSGSFYKLLAFESVEAKLINSYNDEFARCPAPSGTHCPTTLDSSVMRTYAVYSAGAEGI